MVKQWEAEVLISSLLKLTRSETITWEFVEYSPPMLIETDDLFISQELAASTEYEGYSFLAEISDTIDVKTGKGYVDLSVTIGEEPETREDALDRYITFFPEAQTVEFANLLFMMLEDEITNSPAWSAARYSAQRFSPEAATAPLSIFGRNLFEHKQALSSTRSPRMKLFAIVCLKNRLHSLAARDLNAAAFPATVQRNFLRQKRRAALGLKKTSRTRF